MRPNLLVLALILTSTKILVTAITHDGEDAYVADWPVDTLNEAKAVAGALGGHSAHVDDPLDGSRVAKQLIFERGAELPKVPLSQLGEHSRDGVITDHYDGYGLNDIILIAADARDTEAGGNASHHYVAMMPSGCMVEDPETGVQVSVQDIVARIDFQHGPRDELGSVKGITDAALLAILLDRYRGFQAGPFKCRENALTITKLEEALLWMKSRAFKRAQRGVLGKLQA